MYPRIPWQLVADPLGSAEHILGTTAVDITLAKEPVASIFRKIFCLCLNMEASGFSKTYGTTYNYIQCHSGNQNPDLHYNQR
jgi:hypothetical protein